MPRKLRSSMGGGEAEFVELTPRTRRARNQKQQPKPAQQEDEEAGWFLTLIPMAVVVACVCYWCKIAYTHFC